MVRGDPCGMNFDDNLPDPDPKLEYALNRARRIQAAFYCIYSKDSGTRALGFKLPLEALSGSF